MKKRVPLLRCYSPLKLLYFQRQYFTGPGSRPVDPPDGQAAMRLRYLTKRQQDDEALLSIDFKDRKSLFHHAVSREKQRTGVRLRRASSPENKPFFQEYERAVAALKNSLPRPTIDLPKYYSAEFHRKYCFREEDLEEYFVKGSGPGGQAINKRMQTCLLVHKPTGRRVRCCQLPSLARNRAIARDLLHRRLQDFFLGNESPTAQRRQLAISEAKAKSAAKIEAAAWGNQLLQKETRCPPFRRFLEGEEAMSDAASQELKQLLPVVSDLRIALMHNEYCGSWGLLVDAAAARLTNDVAATLDLCRKRQVPAGVQSSVAPAEAAECRSSLFGAEGGSGVLQEFCTELECPWSETHSLPAIPRWFRYLFPASVALPATVEEQEALCECCTSRHAQQAVATSFRLFAECFGFLVDETTAATVSLKKDGLNWVEHHRRLLTPDRSSVDAGAVLLWAHVVLSCRQVGLASHADAVLAFFLGEKHSKAKTAFPWCHAVVCFLEGHAQLMHCCSDEVAVGTPLDRSALALLDSLKHSVNSANI